MMAALTAVFWGLVVIVGLQLLVPDWIVTLLAMASLALLFATYFMIGLPQ